MTDWMSEQIREMNDPVYETPMTSLLMLSVYIAGLSFRGLTEDELAKLTPGTELDLVADPFNRFDARAINVNHPSIGLLGFIPAESTVVLHELWNQFGKNIPLSTTITFRQEKKWKEVLIQVRVTLP